MSINKFLISNSNYLQIKKTYVESCLQKVLKDMEERNKKITAIQKILKANQNFKDENLPIDTFYKNYSFIPKKNENDEILSKYICPIRLSSIRYPVYYITQAGKKIIYERSYIIEWLKDHSTDPLSREKISINNYFEDLHTRKIIEKRLKKLKD